tara:strand:+ start:1919 stop:2389 length:471 start_codon:yes stop_codon:yes gene_type:complete
MSEFVRYARMRDIKYVAENMREVDIQEIQAHTGRDPYSTLRSGYENSHECHAILYPYDKKEVMGIFGVSPSPDDKLGIIWMLGTDRIAEVPMHFLRHSRSVIDELHRRYPLLANVMDERNKVHQKWLQWLGFTFIQRHPKYGAEKRPFLEFVRLKD